MSDAKPPCPKCAIGMESLERNGVTIERCGECQGVFLDRGELERLIDAESAYLAALSPDENPNTTYRGRHRRGVLRQVFESQNGAAV
jgi:Zn-finger nucleic acid-binding protein